MTSDAAFDTAQRATIRDERRRLARTRRLLTAALAHPPADWSMALAFVQACVNYIRVATRRLIAQDISLVVELRPTLPKERTDDHAFLDELEARLRQREKELDELIRAMAALASTGRAGLAAFGAAAAHYFAVPNTARSRPMHSLPPLIEAFGSPDSWANAQAAADACGSELAAFEAVEHLIPPGLDALAAGVP